MSTKKERRAKRKAKRSTPPQKRTGSTMDAANPADGEAESMRRIVQRAAQRFPAIEATPTQPGEERMSEVLERFVDPYVRHARDDDDYRKLMSLAVGTWNVSLLPAQKQADFLASLTDILSPPQRQNLREILVGMIERKKRFFADNHRFILEHQLTIVDGKFHLAVISTPPPDSSQEDA